MTKTRAFIKGNFSRRQHKKSFSVGNLLILGTLSMNEDTEKDKNKKIIINVYILIYEPYLYRAQQERSVVDRKRQYSVCLTQFLDFGGISNSGSKWNILGIRGCLKP